MLPACRDCASVGRAPLSDYRSKGGEGGKRPQAAAEAVFAAFAFFRSSRFSLRHRSDNSSSRALSKYASSPPRCSTDFSACALTRKRTFRPRASLSRVTSHKLGRNFRFDLFSAWLFNCPERGNLPLSSQRLVISSSFTATFGSGLLRQVICIELLSSARPMELWRCLCLRAPAASRLAAPSGESWLLELRAWRVTGGFLQCNCSHSMLA